MRAAESKPVAPPHVAFTRRADAPICPAILIADDDLGTRETFAIALRAAGFETKTAATGAEAIASASTSRFAALVIDLTLPDMLGTDLVRTFRAKGFTLPFILVSGFHRTETTVDAVRLGAEAVLDKPVAVDDLCAAVARALQRTDAGAPTGAPPSFNPHSAAERWAGLVVKACEADGDPRTLQEWAHVAGLSYTSLRELCRILGIRAHDARDLARMLRAVMKARLQRCAPENFLDVSDERTVRVLFARAGLDPTAPLQDFSVDDFLGRQRFVDARHPAIQVLRTLLP